MSSFEMPPVAIERLKAKGKCVILDTTKANVEEPAEMGAHILLASEKNFEICIRRGVYGCVMPSKEWNRAEQR